MVDRDRPPETSQQGVAASQDTLVRGELRRVRRVNLGHGEVEPATAARGRAGPKVEVRRSEADGQEATREIGQASDDAVDTRSAAHAGGLAVVRARAGNDHLDFGRTRDSVDFGAQPREAFGGWGVEAHPSGLGTGPQALG